MYKEQNKICNNFSFFNGHQNIFDIQKKRWFYWGEKLQKKIIIF